MSSTNARISSKASNEIFIGKKDVAQIIVKRMDTLGYKVGPVKVGTESIQSDDGRTRNVSTIEVSISRAR